MMLKINKEEMKKIAANFSLLILSIIFVLILTEIIVRSFFPVSDALYNGDSFIGYKHIQNQKGLSVIPEHISKVKFNSEGFRDIEHKIENPENRYRIIFLGDSFTDALEVDFEKSFHQLIGKELEEKYPRQFEVFNFGIGAFGTGQEYLTYKYYAKKYDPDLVILMFFTNDPSDNCCDDPTKPCFYIENGEVKQNIFKPRMHSAFELFIANNFKIFVFLRAGYYKIKRIFLIKKEKEKKGILEWDRVFLKEYNPKDKECWNITHYFLKQLKRDIEGSGGKLKVFIIPNSASIYEKDKKELIEGTNLTESSFDFDKPYKKIKEILKEENIDYIDPINDFNKQKKRVYYLEDVHFNELGHKVSAEIILKGLKKG